MRPNLRCLAAATSLCLALLLGACSTLPADPPAGAPTPPARALLQTPDRALEERILALDPERITDRDVRETLARGPTPHIMLLHGGSIRAVSEEGKGSSFIVELPIHKG